MSKARADDEDSISDLSSSEELHNDQKEVLDESPQEHDPNQPASSAEGVDSAARDVIEAGHNEDLGNREAPAERNDEPPAPVVVPSIRHAEEPDVEIPAQSFESVPAAQEKNARVGSPADKKQDLTKSDGGNYRIDNPEKRGNLESNLASLVETEHVRNDVAGRNTGRSDDEGSSSSRSSLSQSPFTSKKRKIEVVEAPATATSGQHEDAQIARHIAEEDEPELIFVDQIEDQSSHGYRVGADNFIGENDFGEQLPPQRASAVDENEPPSKNLVGDDPPYNSVVVEEESPFDFQPSPKSKAFQRLSRRTFYSSDPFWRSCLGPPLVKDFDQPVAWWWLCHLFPSVRGFLFQREQQIEWEKAQKMLCEEEVEEEETTPRNLHAGSFYSNFSLASEMKGTSAGKKGGKPSGLKGAFLADYAGAPAAAQYALGTGEHGSKGTAAGTANYKGTGFFGGKKGNGTKTSLYPSGTSKGPAETPAHHYADKTSGGAFSKFTSKSQHPVDHSSFGKQHPGYKGGSAAGPGQKGPLPDDTSHYFLATSSIGSKGANPHAAHIPENGYGTVASEYESRGGQYYDSHNYNYVSGAFSSSAHHDPAALRREQQNGEPEDRNAPVAANSGNGTHSVYLQVNEEDDSSGHGTMGETQHRGLAVPAAPFENVAVSEVSRAELYGKKDGGKKGGIKQSELLYGKKGSYGPPAYNSNLAHHQPPPPVHHPHPYPPHQQPQPAPMGVHNYGIMSTPYGYGAAPPHKGTMVHNKQAADLSPAGGPGKYGFPPGKNPQVAGGFSPAAGGGKYGYGPPPPGPPKGDPGLGKATKTPRNTTPPPPSGEGGPTGALIPKAPSLSARINQAL
ncbi:unnamed protein product [Amoebophrya sp. A120]|nr:unnamed protein product [Amoebophrya sp. A120]|eukprot:GSA120T00019087001.1